MPDDENKTLPLRVESLKSGTLPTRNIRDYLIVIGRKLSPSCIPVTHKLHEKRHEIREQILSGGMNLHAGRTY